MTPRQEIQFDEMHEALIRMEAFLVPTVKSHDEALFGNGKPGIKEELALVKQAQIECRKERAAEPAKTNNKIAIIALIIASASPFVAHMLL